VPNVHAGEVGSLQWIQVIPVGTLPCG
jgi:hypothetical protein